MASLLSLSLEIRFFIYEYLLFTKSTPPQTASDLDPDQRFTISQCQILFEKVPAISPGSSLHLVNRQLHIELSTFERSILSRGTLDYEIDLIFLDNGSVWPTWTSVPICTVRGKSTIRNLTANFRFFKTPDMMTYWPYEWYGGLRSHQMTRSFAYCFLFPLLQYGPRITPRYYKSICDYGSALCDPTFILPYPNSDSNFGSIIHHLIMNFEPVTPEGLSPTTTPKLSPGTDDFKQARQYAVYVSEQLSKILRKPYWTCWRSSDIFHTYSSIMFGRIGTFDFYLGGTKYLWQKELSSELATHPWEPTRRPESYSSEQNLRECAAWILRTIAKRRKQGFARVSSSFEQQIFLVERYWGGPFRRADSPYFAHYP